MSVLRYLCRISSCSSEHYRSIGRKSQLSSLTHIFRTCCAIGGDFYPRCATGLLLVHPPKEGCQHSSSSSILLITFLALALEYTAVRRFFISPVSRALGCRQMFDTQSILHSTGLRVDLTIAELFLCPSRLARFVMAYRALALYMEKNIWASVKRFLHQFTFAIERDDRLFFSSSFLRVYGKDLAWTTECMASLITEGRQLIQVNFHEVLSFTFLTTMNIQAGRSPRYDPYDPCYMQCALQLPDNLGHLIFGAREWAILARLWGCPTSGDHPSDLVTCMGRECTYAQQLRL